MNAPVVILIPTIDSHADSSMDITDVWSEQFNDDDTVATAFFVHADVTGCNERHEDVPMKWPEIYALSIDGPLGRAVYDAEWARNFLGSKVCDRLEKIHEPSINDEVMS